MGYSSSPNTNYTSVAVSLIEVFRFVLTAFIKAKRHSHIKKIWFESYSTIKEGLACLR
jgi:hypothetical protein